MKPQSIYEVQIFNDIYEDNNIEKTNDNQLMVYFVGSPTYEKKAIINNDLHLPVYIHWSNKKKGISTFIEYNLNWLDLRYVKISSLINFDGTIRNYTFPKEIANKYKKKIGFGVKTFELQDPLHNFEYVDFSTVSKSLEVLKKINEYSSNILKNEKLVTFKLANNKTLIIPGIEVVNYFYLNSQYKSLKRMIVRENAMEKLVKKLPPKEDADKIYLKLKRRAKLKDKQLIFYFAYNKKYQGLFNDVYTNFLNNAVICAPIPTEKTIKLNVHYYERNNCIYVLKILKSTHHKEELVFINKDIIVTHPKKVDAEYTERKKKPKPGEKAGNKKNLDTNNSSTVSSSIDNVQIEDFNEYNVEEHEDFEFTLDMHEVKLPKKEERAKTPKVNKNVPDKPLSSRDEEGSKGDSIGSEVNDDKKTSKKLDYDELIKTLQKENFDIVVHHGSFKTVASHLLKIKKLKKYKKFHYRIDSYMDNKETYRSYILMEIKNKEKRMFFFDVEPRELYDKKTKKVKSIKRNSILLVERDVTIKEFYKEYIGSFIYKFSVSGGKWVGTVDKLFKTERHFFLKHSSVDGLFKSISDKFNL